MKSVPCQVFAPPAFALRIQVRLVSVSYTMSLPRILFCNCTYAQVVPKAVKDEVLRELAAADVAFDAVADLCELSARKDPSLKELADGGPVRIAACYPRSVRWLFSACGAPLPAEGVEILNMRTETAEDVVQSLLGKRPAPQGEPA